MVAHRLYARDSFVEGLAKTQRFLKLDGVNFGRIEDAGKLAQLARGVILLTGKLLRDLVKAVDDAPSDARRDGGKAGVGKQVDNLTGDLGGNDPRAVGVGHVFGGWFVVVGKLAAGGFAAERARNGDGDRASDGLGKR